MSLRSPLSSLGSNAVNLPPGAAWMVPRGWYTVLSGGYASVQNYDPITTAWLPLGNADSGMSTFYSDGISIRVANQTSCPIGSIVTNGGSGYITPPTVTPSEGNSQWTAILGSTVASISVIAGGANYNYPPSIIISPPASPGYPATAVPVMSGKAVASVTMINVGAGYLAPPSISVIPDPRDTAGGGAILAPVLANQGKVTGVVCTDYSGGTLVTSGTVPTLTFSGGGGSGAAATAIMCWTVTGVTVANGGAGYGTVQGAVGVTTSGNGVPLGSAAYTNPRMEGGQSFIRTRPLQYLAGTTAGVITSAYEMVDGGIFGGVASNLIVNILSNTTPTTLASLTLTVGGANSLVYIQAAGPPSP